VIVFGIDRKRSAQYERRISFFDPGHGGGEKCRVFCGGAGR
jgi:hypothetical protein